MRSMSVGPAGAGAAELIPTQMAVVSMPQSGLFAHLSARFGSNPEILAAEALAYLLTTSPAMRDAVLEVCSIAAPGIASATGGVQFRASAPCSDGRAPTLLGVDAEGVMRFVVDPRFWSALAE